MVKISELVTDASIGGAEQLVVNDGGTTKKTTVDAILARTHNHTASQVTDFNTAVDARIDVPNDTAKTTPVDTDVFALWDTIRKKVTRANIKATLKTYFDTLYHTKNALRTGLTASKLLSTDGSGNEGYTDLSTFATLASDTEFHEANSTKSAKPSSIWLYFTIIAGTNLFANADTERSVLGTTYTKVKEITILKTGTYTIEFDLRNGGATTGYGRVYKNGVAFGTEQSQATNVYTTKTENLAFTAGDLCQLYLKHLGAGGTSYAQNFRVKGALAVNPEGVPDAYIGTVVTN